MRRRSSLSFRREMALTSTFCKKSTNAGIGFNLVPVFTQNDALCTEKILDGNNQSFILKLIFESRGDWSDFESMADQHLSLQKFI